MLRITQLNAKQLPAVASRDVCEYAEVCRVNRLKNYPKMVAKTATPGGGFHQQICTAEQKNL